MANVTLSLDNVLELRLRRSSGNEFQAFFSNLMAKVYPENFVTVTAHGRLGDRGMDGYLQEQRAVIQCYGAKNGAVIDINRVCSKLKDDYASAFHNFPEMKEWWFCHNLQEMPERLVSTYLDVVGEAANNGIKVRMKGPADHANMLRDLSPTDISALLDNMLVRKHGLRVETPGLDTTHVVWKNFNETFDVDYFIDVLDNGLFHRVADHVINPLDLRAACGPQTLFPQITDEELKGYEADYEDFLLRFSRNKKRFPQMIKNLSSVVMVPIEVTNTGTQMDEHIKLDVLLSGSGKFVPESRLKELNDWKFKDPIALVHGFKKPDWKSIYGTPERNKFEDEYLKEVSGSAFQRSYRCGKLLQGSSDLIWLPIEVSGESEISLDIQIMSRELPAPVRITKEIKVTTNDYNRDMTIDLLKSNIEAMPGDQKYILSEINNYLALPATQHVLDHRPKYEEYRESAEEMARRARL